MTMSHQLLKANTKIIVFEFLLTKRVATKLIQIQFLTTLLGAVGGKYLKLDSKMLLDVSKCNLLAYGSRSKSWRSDLPK